MHGEKDRLISPLNARRMTRRIPGARLRLIAGAGHMYRHDRPRESHDLLLDFLMEAAGRLLDRKELQLKLEQAEAIIDAQKKLAQLLDNQKEELS
jgi:hypothetical protein